MFPFEENRQEDVSHHNEWQSHETEDDEADNGQSQKDEANLVAFPLQVSHLEGEKLQIAHHHKGKHQHDADAVAHAQTAIGEMPDLC